MIFGVPIGAILLNSGVLIGKQGLGGGGEGGTSGGSLLGAMSSSLDSLVEDVKTKADGVSSSLEHMMEDAKTKLLPKDTPKSAERTGEEALQKEADPEAGETPSDLLI